MKITFRRISMEKSNYIMNELTREKALNLINQLPIIFFDTDFGDTDEVFVYLIEIEDNEQNRKILNQLGFSDAYIDRFKSWKENRIELSSFVWTFVDTFDGDKFYIN